MDTEICDQIDFGWLPFFTEIRIGDLKNPSNRNQRNLLGIKRMARYGQCTIRIGINQVLGWNQNQGKGKFVGIGIRVGIRILNFPGIRTEIRDLPESSIID